MTETNCTELMSDLRQAIVNLDAETISTLIAAGASVERLSNFDESLVSLAINSAREAAENYEEEEDENKVSLYESAAEKLLATMQVLVAAGAETNARRYDEQSPLTDALIPPGFPAVVTFLLNNDADPYWRDDDYVKACNRAETEACKAAVDDWFAAKR